MAIVNYVVNNWTEILALGAALHGLALVIVNTTRTPKDNEAYAKLYKVIEVIAGIITKIAKK
jgi:hypothetical protein